MGLDISDGGIPLGIKIVHKENGRVSDSTKLNIYKVAILVMTFISYTCYHMSRKPISVVKTILIDCNETLNTCESFIDQIDGKDEAAAKRLESSLDSAYLFSYAFFMFITGMMAERIDLRYFLCFGMILSGILTMLFGLAYTWGIHNIVYFIFVQIASGFAQATGWPSVVTIVANWFGKGKKGAIFGIWNSHTSIGNILGSILAGVWVEDNWALSFVVPGIIISGFGFIFFFWLVPKPEMVGLQPAQSNQVCESDWDFNCLLIHIEHD